MSDFGWQFDRHYEQFRERSKTASRFGLVTAVFAVVLVVRVISPYRDITTNLHTRGEALAAAKAQQSSVLDKQEAQAQLVSAAANARAAIQTQPWEQPKEDLKRELSDLNQAFNQVSNLNPQQLRETSEKISQRGGFQDQSSNTGEPSFDRFDPAISNRMSVLQNDRNRIDTSQIHPNRMNPNQMDLRANRNNAPIGLEIAPPPDLDQLQRETAVQQFNLTPELLSSIQTESDQKQLLSSQYRTLWNEAGDRAVRLTEEECRRSLLEPMRKLLATEQAPHEFAAVAEVVNSLSSDLELWTQRHIQDRSWMEMVATKDGAIRDLTTDLQHWQQRADDAVASAQKRIEREQAALDEQSAALDAQIKDLAEQRKKLDADIDRFLPEWLRGMVSATIMMQLYPAILILLVIVVAHNSWMARLHYLEVEKTLRHAKAPEDPFGAGSAWTLCRRAPGPTARTALLYLGGLALLWFMLEVGVSNAQQWIAIDAKSESPLAWSSGRQLVVGLGWVGRLIFAALALIIIASLVKRHHVDAPPGERGG